MNKQPFQHLEVSNLTVQFITAHGLIQPVDRVSFEIRHGEDLGLIGESGCGKTVTALSPLGFERGKPGIVAGRIQLNGVDLLPNWGEWGGKQESKGDDSQPEFATIRQQKQKRWREWEQTLSERMSPFRGTVINISFQEPTKMLDPLFSIGKQLTEAVVLSDPKKRWSKTESKKVACEWLQRVEMPEPEKVFSQYPHQLSGGMLQRVILAMALATKPGLLIADEPTTALDVTIGSKILLLLKKLCQEEEMTLLIISHDLAVIRELTQRVIVMCAGQVVETLSTAAIAAGEAKHPYTRALMEAQVNMQAIQGEVPKPNEVISGCRFHPRCPLLKREKADDTLFVNRCKTQSPALSPIADAHCNRCWNYEED